MGPGAGLSLLGGRGFVLGNTFLTWERLVIYSVACGNHILRLAYCLIYCLFFGQTIGESIDSIDFIDRFLED